MDIEKFRNDRLDDQISYFSNAASREQKHGKQWQNALIGAAAATPLLIGLSEIAADGSFLSQILRAAALISSFIAAVATGILSTRKYWENGVMYRAREQTLIRERVLFDNKAGDYAPGASEMPPEQLLVEKVEAIIADDVANWTNQMKDASQRATPKKKT